MSANPHSVTHAASFVKEADKKDANGKAGLVSTVAVACEERGEG